MAISQCGQTSSAIGREQKKHGTALFPAACYDDDLAQDEVPWHWHEELEAIVVTEGVVEVATDRERVLLNIGDGCFINSEVLHTILSKGNCESRIHSVVFHPRLIGGASESIFWQKYLRPIIENKALPIMKIAGGGCKKMISSIERAWECIASEPAGYELSVRNALSDLVLELTSSIPSQPAKPSETKEGMRSHQKNADLYSGAFCG
jgi:mannose-6-phosphate isomerase-like protein (cupin superfamily)